MYASLLSEQTSIREPSGALVLSPMLQGAHFIGSTEPLRVIARGGFYFDAHPEGLVHLPRRQSPIAIKDLRTGMPLYSPHSVLAQQGETHIPYDYAATDNHGKTHRFVGVEKIDNDKAELLGWLIGDGNLTAERQSIRFASSDVWSLSRVEDLVKRVYPTMKVSWYAKAVGFDITLTGGINNPLKHLIRRLDFVEGFPTAIGKFSQTQIVAFLRGVWGCHGWVSSRKGGNDVDLGLRRTTKSACTSLLRHLHVFIGMHGQRRDTPTQKNPDTHRLVFSGYANYRLFFDTVGRIGEKQLPHPPVRRRSLQPSTVSDSSGNLWYETPIQKIIPLRETHRIYEVPHAVCH